MIWRDRASISVVMVGTVELSATRWSSSKWGWHIDPTPDVDVPKKLLAKGTATTRLLAKEEAEAAWERLPK